LSEVKIKQIRANPMDDKRLRSDRERDPAAELARQIAQADTREESAPSDNRSREKAPSHGHDETPELPPAPQLEVDLNEHEQTSECDEYGSGDQAHGVDDQLYSVEEYQNNEVPRVRRRSLTLLMGIFGLGLIGTACAVGYRDIVAGSLSPTIKAINERSSIPSAPSDPPAESSGNARPVDTATTGSIDNMVSRGDRPATIGSLKGAARASRPGASATTKLAADQAVLNQAVPGVALVAAAPPPAIAAAPQRPGQSSRADVTTASSHGHSALARVANANSDSTAAVTAPVLASGYAVQVASERSKSLAQAAFRALQAKYPNQLRAHQPIIRRADLGAAGIYYRTLVGPFASAKEAATLCSGLKAAGGDCVIQKNYAAARS
jgi:SPOR domain